MNQIEVILQSIHAEPTDETAWLALADCFEEQGEGERAELARLHVGLRRTGGEDRLAKERRAQELIGSGARPVVPEVVNSIGMRLALVPAGSFLMGSPESEEHHEEDEGPVHEVTLTRPFYFGVFHVTVRQFGEFLRATDHTVRPEWRPIPRKGSRRKDLEEPAWHISWNDALAYCAWLGEKEGEHYRLPTEAEWEYACRAGTTTPFHCGPTLSYRDANFAGEPYGDAASTRTPSNEKCKAGSYAPNLFGLYDMHGNVWHWCGDWFSETYYRRSPKQDPQGPSKGTQRVERGGSWRGDGFGCRAAFRTHNSPDTAMDYYGFRVVRQIGPVPTRRKRK